MTKTLSEIMANFTPEEQAEIQAVANQLIAEEMTLRELRKAYHLTQMKIKSDRISVVARCTENKH